jgi:hypothetical protein
LKLSSKKTLSRFGFNFNLRRYIVAASLGAAAMMNRMGEQWEDEDGNIVRGPTEAEARAFIRPLFGST